MTARMAARMAAQGAVTRAAAPATPATITAALRAGPEIAAFVFCARCALFNHVDGSLGRSVALSLDPSGDNDLARVYLADNDLDLHFGDYAYIKLKTDFIGPEISPPDLRENWNGAPPT
jgi:hypothetical protein